MTVPSLMKAADFEHISERESDGSWEDCTWVAGLEWYRLCYDASKPATLAEAERLRAASGEPSTGGSNVSDFKRGVRVRYDRFLPVPLDTYTALKAALKPGTAALVQGSMKAFGPSHRLSKWQTNFDGGHAVLVVNVNGTLYWCDPLAPESADVPVTVTWAELEAYVKAFRGQHLVKPVLVPVSEEEDMKLVRYLPGFTANIKPASNVRSAPDIQSTLLRKSGTAKEPVTVIGTVRGDPDPGNDGNTEWFAWWKNGRIEYTATDNILDLRAPSAGDDGFTKATQDAAVAAANTLSQAKIDALQAQVNALKPDATLGTALRSLVKSAQG